MNLTAEVVRFRLTMLVNELGELDREARALHSLVDRLGEDWVEFAAYLGNAVDDLEEAFEELNWLLGSMNRQEEAK